MAGSNWVWRPQACCLAVFHDYYKQVLMYKKAILL